MIQFGTNPIAWANDDDENLGADIPTEQILQEAGQVIGFDGIENGHRWPQHDAEALKQLLGSYGMKFISGWHSLNLLTNSMEVEKAAIQPHLDKLKHNGCKVVIVCETSNSVQGLASPVNDAPTLSAETMMDFCDKTEEMARYCQDQGIELAYHHHMGTVIETPEQIDAFMEATGPATKLLFDTGHYFFGSNGQDPAQMLMRHAERVVHFHAKNVRPDIMQKVRDDGLSFMDGVRAGVFTVPGDGEGGIDFAPLLHILKETGYEGWIVIEAEQDPHIRNPLTYQTLGFKTLKTIAKEVGLT